MIGLNLQYQEISGHGQRLPLHANLIAVLEVRWATHGTAPTKHYTFSM